MRTMLRAVAVLLTLTLVTGCTQLRTITTTIENPVGPVDVWRVKNTYAAALEAAVEYRTYCWSQPYETLMSDPVAKALCGNRRAVVRAFQSAQFKASAAIITMDRFVRDNPTISAASAITAAWRAVGDFKNAIPARVS